MTASELINDIRVKMIELLKSEEEDCNGLWHLDEVMRHLDRAVALALAPHVKLGNDGVSPCLST